MTLDPAAIPKYATHYSVNVYALEGADNITYWCKRNYLYMPESARYLRSWHRWEAKEQRWVHDGPGTCDRHFKSITPN